MFLPLSLATVFLGVVVRIFLMSTLDAVLAQLRQQPDALNKAIAALEGVSSNGSSP